MHHSRHLGTGLFTVALLLAGPTSAAQTMRFFLTGGSGLFYCFATN